MAITITIYRELSAGSWSQSKIVNINGTPISNVGFSGELYEFNNGDTRLYYIKSDNKKYYIYYGAEIPIPGYGPSSLAPGMVLGDQPYLDGPLFGGQYYRITGNKLTVQSRFYTVYTGSRDIEVKASGGSVMSPSIGDGVTIIAASFGDINAHPDFLTLIAGEGTKNSGTLLTRGKTEGEWNGWTMTNGVLTTGGELMDTEITVSLLEGRLDGLITANFKREDNPDKKWSPKLGNMVIHLTNHNLIETHVSVNYVSSHNDWSSFVSAANFTNLSCSSGGLSRKWVSSLDFGRSVYLLNVETAVFSVTPGTAGTKRRVQAWKLENPDGTFVDFGANNSVTMYNFQDGCKIHLYLTTASPSPRIIYEGFDSAGIVPLNTNVIKDGVEEVVGSSWISPDGINPFAVTLSPVAWQWFTLGRSRSYIVDDGEAVLLPNRDGTSAVISSKEEPFSITRVKFKEEQIEPDGVLTVNINQDTDPLLSSVNVGFSQGSIPLEGIIYTLEDSGPKTTKYYVGGGNIGVGVYPDYGGRPASDFVITITTPINETSEDDSDNNTSLSSALPQRQITVKITEKVEFGSVSKVQINLSRTVGFGEYVADSDGSTIESNIGSLYVPTPSDKSTAIPLSVDCSARQGYKVKTILVYSYAIGDDLSQPGDRLYAAVAAKTGISNVLLSIPREYNNDDIRVVLVMEAEVVELPKILPMIADDAGKFTASYAHAGGIEDDFRVGDRVILSASVVTINGMPLPGAAIGTPTFNDIEVIPIRSGTSISAEVVLGRAGNVFKIPVYALLETESLPVEAGEIVLSTTWNAQNTLVINDVTYYRLGLVFTVSAPLQNPAETHTIIAGRVNRRIISDDFNYIESGMLLPTVIDDNNRGLSAPLLGPTKISAIYAAGVQYPSFTFAVYDYESSGYVTVGLRPTIITTAIAPATLSDNLIEDIVWPESGTPGVEYENAAFLYRRIESEELLPSVAIRAESERAFRFEMWNSATSSWVLYGPSSAILSDEYTYFRVAVGTPPENLVSVEFKEAVRVDSNDDQIVVQGGKIYAVSGEAYDRSFKLPHVLQTTSRSVMHVRFAPPPGYVVTGWYINDVLTPYSSSVSVIIPDEGLVLKPQIAARQTKPTSVMVLNGDSYKRDKGVWVSKLFRSQFPWKPLTAHIVARPSDTPITLGIIKDGEDAPESVDSEDPNLVVVNVTGDKMRRLPPGNIQKTRFVRYIVSVDKDVSISSVAIGSGSETMKGGH